MLYLSKIATVFITPLGLCIGLTFLGIFLMAARLRKTGLGLVVLGTTLLWVASMQVTSRSVPGSLERQYSPAALSLIPSADVAIGQRTAQARDRKPLAWRSAHQDVSPGDPVLVTEQREIAMEGHVGVMMREHRPRKGLDLGEGQRPEAKRVPGDGRSFDP